MFVATVALKADVQGRDWLIDSGASRYMIFQREVLYNYRTFETPEPLD